MASDTPIMATVKTPPAAAPVGRQLPMPVNPAAYHDSLLWIFVSAGACAAIAGGTGWLPVWLGFAFGGALAVTVTVVVLAPRG